MAPVMVLVLVMEREWIGVVALPLAESAARGFGIAQALVRLWSQAWLEELVLKLELVLELERVQVLVWERERERV